MLEVRGEKRAAQVCGVGALASATQLNRQTLYRTLSDEGNPTLTTLVSIFREVGVKLSFAADAPRRTP